jgi:tetratricopeptide (TPR) repeat protein
MNVDGNTVNKSASLTEPVMGPIRPGGEVDRKVLATSRALRAPTTSHGDQERVLEEWQKRALTDAINLRVTAESRATPAAFTRLAHAEMVAGNLEDSVRAADRALEIVVRELLEVPSKPMDVSSAIAAIHVFLQVGYKNKVPFWLHKLPRISPLVKLEASLAADERRWEIAEDLLKELPAEESSSLLGYILLNKGKPAPALAALRLATRIDADADSLVNMAFAFWELGATRKSVRSAMQAKRLAPGRVDITFALIDILLASDNVQDAEKEIARLKEQGIVEIPRFLVLQAKVAIRAKKSGKSLALLRRAQDEAKRQGDDALAEELEANLFLFSLEGRKASRKQIWDAIRKKLEKSPESFIYTQVFADVSTTTEESKILSNYIRRLSESQPPEDLLFLKYKQAFLQFNFREAVEMAEAWSKQDSFSAHAAATALLLHAQVTGDLESASRRARRAVLKFGYGDVNLINNAAYVLATAGHPREARDIVSRVDSTDMPYYLVATSGLVDLALGEIDSGLKLYRRAAELVSKNSDSSVLLAFMRAHQVLALRRLGIYELLEPRELLAKSLPDVPLPENWMERADFVLLQRIYDACGWPWLDSGKR